MIEPIRRLDLNSVVTRRLRSHSKDCLLFCLVSVAVSLTGMGLLIWLWHEFQTNEDVVISEIAAIGGTAITTGIFGFSTQQFFSSRNLVRLGRDWQALYRQAMGPPPNEKLEFVEGKLYDWLGK